jgi:hypothetical protein
MSKQLDALNEMASAQDSKSVCLAVMAALGRPADFLQVTARRVTTDGHRVNVVAGGDPTQARIAHSFFVTTDAAGAVTGSVPPLVRVYGGATGGGASPRPA